MFNSPEEQGDGQQFQQAAPSISLPKGGGAIKGIGEKFAANPVTGTSSLTVPIATSPGRSGFGPQLSLSYDSGAGNGPFGLGWRLSLPSITRKTDKGIPRYEDADESDVFILSGAEDLVPVLEQNAQGKWARKVLNQPAHAPNYRIDFYRPRIEGLFARIERWTNINDAEDVCWRSISKDNITTWYGKTTESRIADPEDPTRIFSWLICQSYDDKGNAIVYEYVEENSERIFEDDQGNQVSLVHERNRNNETRKSNCYLKRIKYGNRTPNRNENWEATDPTQLLDWMFEVVFDYGEGHYQTLPLDTFIPEEAQHRLVEATLSGTSLWPARQDPFSSYRAGFEVRTYRLCHRVLMFHHFPDELGAEDYLVRSTDLSYDEGPIASFITSVSQSGYTRQDDGSYLQKSLPPLEFEYSRAVISDEITEIDDDSLDNLPYGLDGSQYRWVDLDGEGISGILTEQGDGWYYKPNLSPITVRSENGRERVVAGFGPLERVAEKPSLGDLNGGRQQLLDLAGDGQLDLALLDAPTPGFFERTYDERWATFRAFESLPNVNWNDPNLRFVDLTGDGHADILITEDNAFNWHLSLAEAGFSARERVQQLLEEERGPRLVFADGTQSIYLADLSGDNLVDMARIRNGEVCYWPNLGYGRFGAKVTMDNAPRFDVPDLFDQRRIRLADIDGSGTTDIIYVGHGVIYIYRNQSGNSWEDAHQLTNFPHTNDLSSVTVTDLLGNGTACLVWSSPLPADTRKPMRYLDLMGGQKPHLLVRTVNNLGAETRVQYAPSTRFYLADKQAGNPWITRLPFPVHVVERIETYDHISRNRFVNRYTYHHGYFDGIEREFRGFGRVEQIDTEEFVALSNSDQFPAADNIDQASHVPPVLTKTWFHTGAYLQGDYISRQFEAEYYREPGLSDNAFSAQLLPDTALPPDLTSGETREAVRALKGVMLRQEVYAMDGTPQAAHPYTVSERSQKLKLIQPREDKRHVVFHVCPCNTLDFHYERNPDDPRITHQMSLEVDEFGNVLRAAAIVYGRRQPDPSLAPEDQAEQTQLLITCMENDFTNPIDLPDDYRTPLPAESRSYELTGLSLNTSGRFDLATIDKAVQTASEIPYEGEPDGSLQRRLIEHIRTLYRRNDLAGFLPPGDVESLALPGESYQLAFTPGLVTQIFGNRVTETMLANEGKYGHSENDDNWWIPSGQIFYSPNPADVPVQELAFAREHFFLPHRFRDPFVATSFVRFDAHGLLLLETEDPLGNKVRVGDRDAQGNVTNGNTYRVLQPKLVTGPNHNRTEVAFDALGMVVGMAVMGKLEETLGDSLAGFNADLTPVEIGDHLANPLADPHAILGRATTRLVYDLFAYHRSKDQLDPQPSVVYTLVRETHGADLAPNQQTKIQHSFSYSDGFGREIQQKIQAEPGPVPRRDANGEIIVDANGQPEMTTDDIAPRWVGSGWKVFNNKGKPVRQYEPFFTDRHGFEFDVRIGVSLVLFYDPVERVVATLHPNHTYGKVVFDPWQQTTWDVNDTVTPSGTQTGDPRTDSDVAGFMRAYFNTQPTAWETWHKQRITGGLGSAEEKAATKAAAHADTPAKLFLDSLGRSFLTVADNGPRGQYKTRVELDIEGNQRAVIDANGRTVMRYDYHMLGNQVRQESMDAGTRWTLNNVAGNPIDSWDSLARVFQTEYDLLQRPLRVQVTGADPTASDQTILTERLIYGEQHPQAESLNLRGQLFMQLDQAGSIATRAFDFKGNPLEATRRLIGGARYKEVIDWIAVDSNTVALPTSPDAMININALTTALDAQLENRAYTISTEYDALNRATAIITPDNSVTRPAYNEANLLDAVTVDLQGSTTTPFVTDIDYNARGQRLFISYGNTATTTYEYDPETFRLTTMRTTHTSRILQDLHYSHDPVGNIMSIRDGAQQTHYFNNSQIEPHTTYTYDAVYQLIEARGREHIGQSGRPEHTTWNDEARMLGNNIPHPNNPQAMRRYTERYAYDAVGNIIDLIHSANNNGAWSRSYAYEQPNNRLTRSIINPNALNPTPLTYDYDAPGNMISMPHLSVMEWDYRDQLQQTARQVVNGGVPQITFYVYDSSGQRIRKVTENSTQRRINERIYLGGYEIYREYSLNDMITLERETLHIMDDQQRIALVEIRTEGNDGSPLQLIRYQFSNHLGSASLELNQQGLIVSYEEYHPYGSTSYQAVTSQIQVSHKRYRYTGMERDEENGFNYHGARYYAPWLGRWISADPAGLVEGVNLYAYVRGNPIKLIDYDGFQSDGPPGSKSIMGRLRKFGNRFGTKIVETVLSVVLDSDPKNPAVDPVDTRGSVSDKKAEPSEKPTDRHKKEIQADKKQKRKGSDVRKSKTKSETVWWSQQDIADDIARQNKGGKPPSKPPSSSPKSPSAGKVSKATKSAKLSKGVRAALTFLGAVPDLTDVGFMFIAAAADIVATKEKMKSRQYNSGFRIGLAAVLLGRSDSNIKGFLRKTARKGEAQIFWGADMGLLEKPYNAGLVAGYAFANDLTTEQSIDVLKSGFAALESEGYNPYTMGGSSTDSFVEHFARALKPTVDKLFEEAAKAQAEEEARRTRELLREHQWTGIMGNKL